MAEKKTIAMAGLTKGRIETLTDSVFAIAMTLMVFNMKVPEIPAGSVGWELSRKLLGMWHEFLIYAHLSYATGAAHLVDPAMHPGMIRLAKKLILTGPAACVVAIIVAFF